MTIAYIAGPMTGLPEFNHPAFHDAADRLRALGLTVENPAENPAPECGTWLGYMRMAIPQVARADALVMLPGWQRSKGACTEARLARNLGLPLFTLAEALQAERS